MVARLPERLVRMLRESPGLLPGVLVIGVFALWAADDGGYSELSWLPGALFVLAVLLVYAFTAPGRVGGDRALWVALGALGAFTAWSYASILWAGVEGEAWTGANRTLLYLLVFTLFALRPWRAGAALVALGAYAFAVAAVAAWQYVEATRSADPLDAFIAGRLATPIAYSNACCALFLSAAFAGLCLASRREVHPLLRGGFLAAAGVLAELALMCQSRASLVAVPATLLVYVTLVPGRTRFALALAPVVLAVSLSATRVLDVYPAVVTGEGVTAALVEARTALVWTAAALAVVGAATGLVDRLLTVPRRVALAGGGAILVLAVAGIAVGSAELVDRYGDPVERASAWWESFKTGGVLYDPNTPHLVSGFGGGRYDVWRVAWQEFREAPFAGIGADNFAAEYLRSRETIEDALYPHSVELRTLSQTGVVGAATLAAFLVACAWAVGRRLTRGSPLERSVTGATATVFVFWLVYGSVDWFWEIPALGAPAFAFLALAVRLGDPVPLRSVRRVPRPLSLAAAAVAGGATAVSLALPWLAADQVDDAVGRWRSDAAGAFDALDRARTLNPLTDEADVIAAVIASEVRDPRRERSALVRALERNPSNWYAHLSLGALDGREGRSQAALAHLTVAKRLNPGEPVIDLVLERTRKGQAVSDSLLDRLFVERVSLLTGERQS